MCEVRGLFKSTPVSTVKGGDSGDTENQSGLRERDLRPQDLREWISRGRGSCVGSMSNCVYVAPHTGGKQIKG